MFFKDFILRLRWAYLLRRKWILLIESWLYFIYFIETIRNWLVVKHVALDNNSNVINLKIALSICQLDFARRYNDP